MERGELKALLRATGCVEDRGEFWFLRDPARGGADVAEAERGGEGGAGWLGVATGGTSGGVRWARHDELTLGAAVRGFCEHFGIERVNAVGVLPSRVMIKGWRVAVFLCFLFTAIMTPTPDPWMMILMALPMVALYFLAVGIAWLIDRRRAKRDASLGWLSVPDDQASAL